MTDDAPTPDGTHHDEDAAAAPQTADDRPSLPEDDSPVLSTTTPDTAGEPRPEDDGADAEPDDEDSAPEPDDEDVQAESGEAEAHPEEEPKAAEPEPDEAEVTEAPEGESDDEPEPADDEDAQAESGVPEPDADVAPTGSDEGAEPDDEDSAPESDKAEDVQAAPGEAEISDAESGVPEPDDEDVQTEPDKAGDVQTEPGEAEAHPEEEPKAAEPEPDEAEVTEAPKSESDDEPEPDADEDVQAESGVPEPDADVAPTGSDEDAEPDDEDVQTESDKAEDVQAESDKAEAHPEEEPKVAEPEPGEAEVTEASKGESDAEPEPDADVAPTGSDEGAEPDDEDSAPEPDDEDVRAESGESEAYPEEEPKVAEPEPDEAEVTEASKGESDAEPEPAADSGDTDPTGSDEGAEPDDEDVQTEPDKAEDVQTEPDKAEDVQAESGEAEAHPEEEPKVAEPGEAEATEAPESEPADVAPTGSDEDAESDAEPEPGEAEATEAPESEPADVAPTGSDEGAEPDDEDVQTEPDKAEDVQAESGEAEAHPEEEPKAAEPEPGEAEATEAPESESDSVEPAGPGEDAESGAEDTVVTPVAETLAAMSARTPAEAATETPTSADSASAAESGDAEPVESDADAEAEPAGGESLAPQSEEAEVSEESEAEEPEPSEAGDAAVAEEPDDEDSAPESDSVELAGPGEDAEPGAEDTVVTPIAETLAAMSARTPAEAATETPEAETPGPEASAESAAGASAAEAPSGDVPATAAPPVSTRIGTILAKIRAALAGLLHGRRPGRGVLAGIIGVGLLVLVWGGAAVATTQHIFAGSTVSGVDVGDMSPDEARQVVADQIGAELAQPAVLSVDEFTDTLVPADSGVAVDAAASIDRLTSPTINPVTLIKRLSGTDVHAVTTVDSGELTNALNARLGTLATGTADAVVTLDGTTPVVTPGADGTGMDVDASVKALSAGWPLGQETIDLVGGTARPAITDDDAKAFVDSVLTPLLSDSLTVTAAGTSVEKTAASRQVVLSPDQIAALTVISTEGGELSAVLDSQRLHDTIIDAMGAIETAPTNAGWTIDGSAEGAAGAKPQYVAPSPGEGIDMDALTQQLVDAGTTGTTSDGRTVALTMITTQPEITTPEKDWGITEVTGEFSTPFSSEPGRDQNLIRGAEQMNGQIVMPGETFSVEQALGPVDYEHGFTDAGVISNGQHVDALGGGLSQIGTTMFNVGFEAGMDDIEHHPHSYYFDRYPAGREATLWTGQKDVKFANSTPYAALIQAWVADGEVHTRIWSTHYYDVSITSSERYNYRPVQTITRPAGAGCQAYSGGNPGFDITVTRTRTAPDKAVPDDVLTTTYDADNNIACGKPGKTR